MTAALETQIQDDMKSAMRAGETLRRDTLRMLIAALKNERIDKGADLDEDSVLAVVRRGVKSRKDSAQQYRDAGRDELADKEEAEIADGAHGSQHFWRPTRKNDPKAILRTEGSD